MRSLARTDVPSRSGETACYDRGDLTVTSLSLRSVRLAVSRDRPLAVLFTLTIFTSAGLLFLVQPMVAKGLLPLFGGTPAVWTTAMLFFQACLLGGYGLAHLTLSKLGPERQSRVQLALFAAALLVLPLTGPGVPSGSDPLVSVLLLLATGVGLPFLVLSMASPVLQRWFSVSGHPRAGNPYVLYIASNLGSLIALLAYPLVVEPALSLDVQRTLWSVLYVAFLGLAASCVLVLFPLRGSRRRQNLAPEEVAATTSPLEVTDQPDAQLAPRLRQRAGWLALAFIPSSLMLGVTAYLTTDIASVPFLWVAPLALYLLTFVVAFSRFAPMATRAASVLLPFLAVAAAVDMLAADGPPVAIGLPLHLALFTVAALLCHGRLAASRPPVARLTEFYLFLALGGVSGGLLNAIVAPQVLDVVAEYPLLIGAALLARYRIEGGARRRWSLGGLAAATFLAAAAVPVALGLSGIWTGPLLVVLMLMSLPLLIFALPLPFGLLTTILLMAGLVFAPPPLLAERNFFGLFRVLDRPGEHVLVHGTTVHGTQLWPPEARPSATGYYHPDGPLGDLMSLRSPIDYGHVGILGLGSGGIAAYGESGQRFTFWEIDPAMADVAADTRYFTYLSSSHAEIEVGIGDGRLLLAEAPSDQFDLLIMDAFSSDSVPVHLITREAFEIYIDRLTADGILVVHISNRYVDLAPVVSAAARDLGLTAQLRLDTGNESDDPRERRHASRWIVLARDPALLSALPDSWSALAPTGRAAWTDSFSDVISVVDWRGEGLR
jgi:hypothetical protein